MQTFFEKIAPFSKQENTAIITDAKKIYESITLFMKNNQEHCIDRSFPAPWMNTRMWSLIFKAISECNVEFNPFDSLPLSLMMFLISTPSIKSDMKRDFKSEELDLLYGNIEQFQHNYAISLWACYGWLKLNDYIQDKLFDISEFIDKLYEFQNENKAVLYYDLGSPGLKYEEYLFHSINLEEDEIKALTKTRDKLLEIRALLAELTDPGRYASGFKTKAGYTHLNEKTKSDLNNFPNELKGLMDNLSILIRYVVKASIKDGLNTWIKERIDSLMQSTDSLVQGNSPAWLAEIKVPPEYWSKVCLPRPDFKPEIANECEAEIEANDIRPVFCNF